MSIHAVGCPCASHAHALVSLSSLTPNPIAPHVETIVQGLNQTYGAPARLSALWSECRKNAVPEAACISICEAGEFVSELAAYGLGLPGMNEIGLIGGVMLGGAYAVYHVYRHAGEHGGHPSWTEAAAYAASTESGCVITAAGTEYVVGKTLNVGSDPFTANNLLLRGASLPVAFGIGLLVMSAFTYFKRDEAARFVARKGILREVGKELERHFEPRGVGITVDSRRVRLTGGKNKVLLEETSLPRQYREDFPSDDFSLYRMTSPVARWDGSVRGALEHVTEKALKNAGGEPRSVRNIYLCSGH